MFKKELYIVGATIVMAVAVVIFFPALGTASSYDLSLTMTGTGKGIVSFPTATCSDTCKLEFLSGIRVQLNATAPSGGTFNGWTGCDQPSGTVCVVYMTSDKSISADFTGPSLVPGSVQGRVINSSGFGVFQASVGMNLEYATGNCRGNCLNALTDSNGNYVINNIVPGTYILHFNNPLVPFGSGFISTFNQWYNATYSRASANLISINSGSSIMNIDAQFPSVGTISGAVTDVIGTGIANVTIMASSLDEQVGGESWTDSSGNYTIQNLPTGTYIITYRANLALGGGIAQNLMTQVAYVTVTAPFNVTGINATLSPGRTISGRITDKDGLPIVAGVRVIDSNGSNISGVGTDSTGAYTALAIPPGSYKVLFMPTYPANGVTDVTQLYSRVFYGGGADYDTAPVVTVTADADVSNINGVLEATGPAVISSLGAAVPAIRIKRDFGAEVVGTPSYRSFMLSNAGTTDLSLGSLAMTGQDFSIQFDRCSGVTLTPLKVCTFQVAFTPQSEGMKTGAITVPSNDPNVPVYTIGLTGSGGAATGNSGTYAVPYTTPGNPVTVAPIPEVNLTFSNVTSGNGMATVTAISILSAPTPSNFRMLNGTSYDITTTAPYSGNVTVCITYDPSTMGNPANEHNLELFHFNGIKWVNITTSINTTSHTICGVTSSLSPFMVAEPTMVFDGFYSPVDNLPTVNSAKAGQAIPVQWRLTDVNGVPVADPASFKGLTSYPIDCGSLSGDPADAIEVYAAGSSGLQYSGNGYWQFNWKTLKTYAGQCRQMVLTLGDGSTHVAYFIFK